MSSPEFLGGLRLSADVQRLGSGHLHPVGQLEAFDASGKISFLCIVLVVAAVEPIDQVELGSLLALGQLRTPDQVVDRRPLSIQSGALVDAGQEARSPVLGVTLGKPSAEGVVHHNEGGQVLVFGAESVGQPRSQAREAHAVHACVDLEQCRGMIVGVGVARIDEGEIIHMFGDVRKDLRDPGTRFAVPVKLERRLHDGPDLVGEEAGVFVKTFQLLAVTFFELRLVVPSVHLARAAVEEQPDDGFGLGGEVAGFRSQGIEIRIGRMCVCCRGQETLIVEKARQGEKTTAIAGTAQEVAT